MTNPFVYGEVVPAAAFVDREVGARSPDRRSAGRPEDLPDLAAPLRQVVARPPGARRGSTSRRADGRSHRQQLQLVRRVPRRLRAGARRRSRRALDRARAALRELLARTRPRSTSSRIRPAAGRLAVSFPAVRTDRDVSRLAQEVFALPGRIAEARAAGWPSRSTSSRPSAPSTAAASSTRSARRSRQQRQVGYVFSGSEPTLMERMLGRSRPFYKAGPVMRLQKIPPSASPTSSRCASSRAGSRRPPASATAIVELAGNLPYDVQRLAHEVWDDARAEWRRTADLDDLHRDAAAPARRARDALRGTWQRLTLAQRAALRAAVLEDGRELLSADVRARYRLSGSSTVQASLGAL